MPGSNSAAAYLPGGAAYHSPDISFGKYKNNTPTSLGDEEELDTNIPLEPNVQPASSSISIDHLIMAEDEPVSTMPAPAADQARADQSTGLRDYLVKGLKNNGVKGKTANGIVDKIMSNPNFKENIISDRTGFQDRDAGALNRWAGSIKKTFNIRDKMHARDKSAGYTRRERNQINRAMAGDFTNMPDWVPNQAEKLIRKEAARKFKPLTKAIEKGNQAQVMAMISRMTGGDPQKAAQIASTINTINSWKPKKETNPNQLDFKGARSYIEDLMNSYVDGLVRMDESGRIITEEGKVIPKGSEEYRLVMNEANEKAKAAVMRNPMAAAYLKLYPGLSGLVFHAPFNVPKPDIVD